MVILHTQQKPGFTLIEILVSISVLLILAVITFQGFLGYANVQRFKSVVSEVRNDIATQRTKTLGSYNDQQYGVYVGTSTIEFFVGDTPVVGDSDSKIISFANYGITATSSFSDGEQFIVFKRLSGEVSATGTITIFDTRTTSSTTFTFLNSGIIQ